ncbi:MAG: phospholipase D-like domain-containing protein [Gemmatimonadota bacterium]|jgi:phosphatidylserine/phosphatidylglycerophosphate/cardiolipin synthase-like enzyme
MTPVLTWILVTLAALPVLFFAAAGFQLWTRLTPLRRPRSIDGRDGAAAPPAGTDEFLEAVGPHLGVQFAVGHELELFSCGDELYPRLLDDLGAAERLITWHVFWFKPGALADRVREVLEERARAGVRVLFLHDWYGSLGIDRRYFRRLREAGVEVRPFRKPGLSNLYKAQQRSHVRTVVIDGEVGYTGGFAVADEWLGDGRSPGEWRDTSVRFAGPAVHSLQVAFAADWVETTGELLTGPEVFPASNGGPPGPEQRAALDRFGSRASPHPSLRPPRIGPTDALPSRPSPAPAEDTGDLPTRTLSHLGTGDDSGAELPSLDPEPSRPARRFSDVAAALFHSAPSLGGTEAERLFALSIGAARERLWISTGYFVPSAAFRSQLLRAVGRGVDVRVLHPGANSDRRPTWYVLRRHYEELLEGGVRIWEYEPTMMHAKTLLADDAWCAIGTANFDNRSMALNDEVSLLVRDERVAGTLAATFEDDLGLSREVVLDEHRRRTLWERAQEWVWAPFEPIL